jgi:SAM-dependent methyltransferase
LPIGNALAGTVVACMSLHDVDDLRATVDEAARVLRPGGYLCVAMVHPFATAQDPSTLHTDRPIVSEPYLNERRFEDHVERQGIEMTFVSTHRPLSAYVSAFVDAGLMLTARREFGTKPIPWLLVAARQAAHSSGSMPSTSSSRESPPRSRALIGHRPTADA